jgi:hypothetical protein
MALNKHHFKDLIEAVLLNIGLHSENVVQLLLATAAQESTFGTHLKQLGNGPALGIFECEPATHKDIWANYLWFKQPLAEKILRYVPDAFRGVDHYQPIPDANILKWNLAYAICVARVQYRRSPMAIPELGDIEGMWRIYKEAYNTLRGRATRDQFMYNYNKYVA